MRRLGDIISDLELLLDEFYLEHDMQLGDVDAIVHSFSEKHYPNHVEQYEDGTNPVRLYGHIDYVKNLARRLKR